LIEKATFSLLNYNGKQLDTKYVALLYSNTWLAAHEAFCPVLAWRPAKWRVGSWVAPHIPMSEANKSHARQILGSGW
jgi:hypothetical protein